ncbi:MAG: ribosomal-processing cysteine protease Prp [Erysipelotrichaceae bacterium]|nr:ribosomal-processing cysteine protease Prp [Erysipelotrichaceae bacterium]
MLLIRIGVKEQDIRVIDISKHAEKQNDEDELYRLVCAGVSAIAVGLCNAIDVLAEEQCDIDFVSDENDPGQLNHITIAVKKNSLDLQGILKVGEIQLRTCAESYQNYIDFKITEV